MSNLKVLRIDNRSFLQIGTEQIEVADYNLKSSAEGSTELSVIIKGTSNVLELSASLAVDTFVPEDSNGKRFGNSLKCNRPN